MEIVMAKATTKPKASEKPPEKPPEPKPTVPNAPAVIIPPFAPTVEVPDESPPAERWQVPVKLVPAKPLADAIRELLEATPVDLATCAGMTPEKYRRYLRARHVAEAVLATEGV